jgi:pimeloyl-ACP methyl ester carboxylesterase
MANLAFEQKSVQLSHGTTNYIEAGSGYPVIMLHGSMIYQGGVDWLPCMPQIAAKLRVLAPDIVGWPTGDSRTNMDGFPTLADFVREFQDELGVESSHLVGTSMGGWVAGLVAYESPNRVGKVVTTGHNGFTTSPNRGFSNWDQPPADEEAREWVMNVTKDADLDAEQLLKDKLERMHDATFVSNFRENMHRMGDGDHREHWAIGRRLSHTTVPTLFLFGENDSAHTMEIAPKLPSLTPDGKLVVMKDSGHRNHIEQPVVFGKNVSDFLAPD